MLFVSLPRSADPALVEVNKGRVFTFDKSKPDPVSICNAACGPHCDPC